MEKKLDSNYTRMLRAILNKSWRLHPTKQQLYGHLPPITKTIKVRRTRHAEHCWRSRDELIRAVLLCTPSHGRAKAWRTYIEQLCADTGCYPEDLPEAMDDREECWERVRDILAGGATRWWWGWFSPGMMRSDKILDVILYNLFCKWPQFIAIFGIFCSVCVWLGWLGKKWMCIWALTCGRKGCFDRHLFWLIPPYFWEFFPYHFTFPLFLPHLLPRHHNIDKVLRNHIIVNIFLRNEIRLNS